MVALKQEIINRLDQLDEAQQLRVLQLLDELQEPKKPLAEVLKLAQQSLAQTREQYGENYIFGSQSLLDEAREERLDDLMGGG